MHTHQTFVDKSTYKHNHKNTKTHKSQELRGLQRKRLMGLEMIEVFG